MSPDPLDDLTKPQLRDYAERLGVKTTSRSTREELVESITAAAAARQASTTSGVTDESSLEHLGFPGQPGHPSVE